MPDLEKINTKIALLEKDAKQGEAIHQRLEVAIERLTDITVSLKGHLVQQETKINKAEQTDEDIFITLESRRKEWDSDLKELHSRINTEIKYLRDANSISEQKIMEEIRGIRAGLDNRVGILEKWRWVIIGCAIMIGLLMNNPVFFEMIA
jgi:chromosome segregation ATPase|tara:strand:- start:1780 stop:2229 length:450 start_codon:yes stop_codon:yes gene_type:complete